MILILFILLLLIIIILYFYNINIYKFSLKLNKYIDKECKEMDKEFNNDYIIDAELISNEQINNFNKEIQQNHDIIKKEIYKAIENNKYISMNNFDDNYNKLLHNNSNWKSIWVKYLNNYVSTSDFLPTLTNISKKYKDIIILNISIFPPNTHLEKHIGVSNSNYRYHYGITIPKGDVKLKILEKEYNWEERKGFVWNDNVIHEAWNNTNNIRIIIYADFLRNFSFFKNIIIKFIYFIISKNKNSINNIKKLNNI